MDYFKQNVGLLTIQESSQPNKGLRIGQIGALHALSAHFIERSEPAIVSLPTGYGKTAVMEGTCFLCRASRVLIIVPTSALRNQTANAFRTLETLRHLGALPNDQELNSPQVQTVEKRVTSSEQWKKFAEADVVVATPHSVSTEITGIIGPPSDFFDLILIDEGHHSPARTWSTFIQAHPNARHVLYSATPFRKDRLQLPGKLVFYYSLRKAVEDRAFGQVAYSAVEIPEGADKARRDNALVQKALDIWHRDRSSNYDHRLLIRTDRVNDGKRLAVLYTDAGLRVEAVSSHLSKASIAHIEEKLQRNELDGVVCVDMFGEGYDFPKFKIAVLHVAHRSLVPTLQFIGRFARTNDERTGTATFIAIPSDVDTESGELYREGVDWAVLLADIADARQTLTIHERETLRSFSETAQPSLDYKAVDPSQFRLPQHIAAYRSTQPPDFSKLPEFKDQLQVKNAWLSQEKNAYLLLTQHIKSPAWSRGNDLADSRHDCFFIKYYVETGIVFIAATQRAPRYYLELINHFFVGKAIPLAFEHIRKVLNGLQSQEFFTVGLRNTSPTATTETYRIVTGSQADRGVRDTDAAFFCQGHFFGRGKANGESEIIGASTRGRAWSNGKVTIPELLKWMDILHSRITSNAINIGRSGLDKLPFGESLQQLPQNTVTADWPKESYREAPFAEWHNDGEARRVCLLDLSLEQVTVAADGKSLTFCISDESASCCISYSPYRSPQYEIVSNSPGLSVRARDGTLIPIAEWLGDSSPLIFYTANLDSFLGLSFNPRTNPTVFKIDTIETRNWNGCEISVEFDLGNPERMTVQRYLQEELLNLPHLKFVIYDHRSGEAADYIVGQVLPNNRLCIRFYHCKGAGGGQPSGERVDNVYELVGQAVKSVRFQRQETLLAHIERRTKPNPAGNYSPFLLGNREASLAAIRDCQPIDIQLEIVAVQPGISAGALTNTVKSIMAAANDSVSCQQSALLWMTSP